MILLFALYWTLAPLAPLNPIEQDTIPAETFQLSGGLAAGNGVCTTGPELSAMFEIRPVHPMLVRGELTGRAGSASFRIWPDGSELPASTVSGNFQTLLVGVTALYYRGTNKMTAYIGLGPVWSVSHLGVGSDSRNRLAANHGINSVSINQAFGYQFMIGLKYRKCYTFEIGVVELRPNAEYRGSLSPGGYFTGSDKTRFSAIHVSIGRIWTVRTR